MLPTPRAADRRRAEDTLCADRGEGCKRQRGSSHSNDDGIGKKDRDSGRRENSATILTCHAKKGGRKGGSTFRDEREGREVESICLRNWDIKYLNDDGCLLLVGPV
jgi:hypothetical protein